ncbi:porin family protein [Devosia sp. PTR5]|uniref:Porin family protein n=1 Tax=Devosia oryzisoli TaxID=2774138 RepID=A0A927FUZ6_9HYPH|nr:outer membrane beta-barrel protein [Devosia oryzisoli]MBD8064566.1 porin family protein [Devosia oryzisoli]
MIIRTLLVGASVAVLSIGGAQAADLIIPTTPEPIYAPAGFDWEGLYAGVRLGGQFTGTGYADQTADTTNGVIGAAVGVNFIPMDPILLGAEVTADWLWNDTYSSGEFFANLRAGAVVTDSALIYALAGVGVSSRDGFDSEGVYQLGGGVEFAVTDAITVRGEVVGQGDFSDTAGDEFFESAKATVGVFYHF